MKTQTKRYIKIGGVILFLIYLSILFYLLFFSEEYDRNIIATGYRYNFIPLKEILRFINYREQLGMMSVMINVVGNVVAFVPFGFFIPIISSGLRKTWKVILLGFLLSLSVEILQLVTRVGSCDIDDLILNTLGAVLGYALFCICNRLFNKAVRSIR